jgi:hypothetical protein
MSKSFIISDIHLGVHALHAEKWVKSARDYFFEWFIPMLKDKARPGDHLYFLGDIFHDRTSIYIPALLLAQEIFEATTKILPTHVMIGNHDMYSIIDPTQNSLRWLKHIDNLFFYERPKIITQDNKKIYILPWIENRDEQMSLLLANKQCDYVFCHSELQGAFDNERKAIDTLVRLNAFKHFNHVFSGHIHIRQTYGNFTYVGAPYHMDRADKNDTKAVFILDMKTGEIDTYENTYSPEYKTLEIATEEDLVKLSSSNVSHDMVDLVLNSNLLLDSKKARKSLLGLMENHVFERVEMFDTNKVKEPQLELKLDPDTFNWEIETITVDFIKLQENMESEIKDEMINIFDKEVFTNYKKLTKGIL